MTSNRAQRLAGWILLRHRFLFFAAVLVLTPSLTPLPAHAQDPPGGLLDLTIEELLELEIVTVGVLGTHTHLKGERMVGYKFMLMSMGGNRDGTQKISTQDVLSSYMVSPLRMTMEMQMVEIMYAPSDAITLMAMVPYRRLSMDHRTRSGVRFTTDASGVGDLELHALFSAVGNIDRDEFAVSTWGPHRLVLRGGLVLPTGSIEGRDDLPTGPDQKLLYPMQVGSGTLSLVPGVVYLGASGEWAWEVESVATVRLGSNDNGYTLGDRLLTTFWLARELPGSVSLSGRASLTGWRDISGADADLNPMMVPTADPALRAGKRLDMALGLNGYFPFGGTNKGVRVGFEAGLPARQWLDGPQLGSDFYIHFGSSWTF